MKVVASSAMLAESLVPVVGGVFGLALEAAFGTPARKADGVDSAVLDNIFASKDEQKASRQRVRRLWQQRRLERAKAVEVARVLACAPADHLGVLSVRAADSADRFALERAFRRAIARIHPDRCEAADAAAAFERVNSAFAALYGTWPAQQLLEALAPELGVGVAPKSYFEYHPPTMKRPERDDV